MRVLKHVTAIDFEHQTLGGITGRLDSEGIVQFRSIPYAQIPQRFRQSVPIDDYSSTARDYTEYSYACPQVPQTNEPFGGSIPGESERRYDEFNCLNLTVSVPREILVNRGWNGKKVPVMVYVHGGGFAEGAHYGSVQGMLYTRNMTLLALSESNPVIIISIHYRLNWFGFLASKDLIDDAKLNNEPPCNHGLFDQRLAFLWVQRNIAGFGGDATQVTAFGESAGSVSISLHMCSVVPLFTRAILSSGSPATIAPAVDMEKHETEYVKLLQHCGIDAHDPNRLDKLRHVPVDALINATVVLRVAPFRPVADKSFFPIPPNYVNQGRILAACSWVNDLIIGDTFFEGYLFSESLKYVRAEIFTKHVQTVLGMDQSIGLCEVYGIVPNMDQNLFWTRLAIYAGDITFSLHCHNICKSLASCPPVRYSQRKIYRYNLVLRNPFPGSIFYGVPGHHFIELLFLFMTLMNRYPGKHQKDTSIEMASRWIAFANGKEPWTPYDTSHQTIAVVNDYLGWTTLTRSQDEALSEMNEEGGRRYRQWEAMADILEQMHEGDRLKAVVLLSIDAIIALSTI